MKKSIYNSLKTSIVIVALTGITVSCERGLSDETEFATFPTTPDIFVDAPVGLTNEFFESIDPDDGANTEGFDVDNTVAFEGTSSIRIDVPTPDDPNGSFIGGVFIDRGEGRDLTGYDALTFYAKASTTVSGVDFGYGSNFLAEDGENPDRYRVTTQFSLTTTWKKFVVPVPNPDVLKQVKGLFFFAAGTQSTGGSGYTFWMDEIRFENLGTVANPRPSIINGVDAVTESFQGQTLPLAPLTTTMDVNGTITTVQTAPIYFDFDSDNNSVASVSDNGIVSVNNGVGTALITGSINGIPAQGSLELTSNGSFPSAPTPNRPASNVVSIYSDAYTAGTQINFAPNFGGSTTQTIEQNFGGSNILNYTNNNFTGLMFVTEFEGGPTIDATNFGNISMDVFVTDANAEIGVQVRDVGPNQTVNTDTSNGNPIEDDADYRFTISGLTPGQWNTITMPLSDGLSTQRDNIGAIILTGGPNFILDNIYLYNN